ncbi:hypothetical protein [Flavimaricola marinus]|uniref:hypothetical protein n=1 Tax=Flavimaricola marinus TaxID=1819565 RepID=UPI001455912C|nr:hypothetical protein [Flavimaricola marinus]
MAVLGLSYAGWRWPETITQDMVTAAIGAGYFLFAGMHLILAFKRLRRTRRERGAVA